MSMNRLAESIAYGVESLESISGLLKSLKVHKREKFFGSDFEFFTIL